MRTSPDSPSGRWRLCKWALPVLRGVQTDAPLMVKDHAPQPLRDMNAEQIAALAPGQLAAITRGLAQDIALVESFGYRLRG